MKVTTSGLSVEYEPGHPVISDLSLDVTSGRRLAILGPSGSGKSTLLAVIAGLLAPRSGTVSLGDRVVSSPRSMAPPRERDIGMVFQKPGLWPHMTVENHLRFVLDSKKISKEVGDARIARVLEQVSLKELADRRPTTLSGGEAQRLSLARAVVGSPSLYLLDEPLSSLDRELRKDMLELIDDLTGGATVILVTHDISEAAAFAEDIAVLADTTIQQHGPYRDLYARPVNRTVAKMCGPCAILDATTSGTEARTSIGTLQVSPDSEGTRVLIRPEQIHARENGSMAARIRACVPDGSGWRVSLELEEQRIEVPLPDRAEIGTSFRFDVAGEVHVM